MFYTDQTAGKSEQSLSTNTRASPHAHIVTGKSSALASSLGTFGQTSRTPRLFFSTFLSPCSLLRSAPKVSVGVAALWRIGLLQKFGLALFFLPVWYDSPSAFSCLFAALLQCRSHFYYLLDWNAHAHGHNACVGAGLIGRTRNVPWASRLLWTH